MPPPGCNRCAAPACAAAAVADGAPGPGGRRAAADERNSLYRLAMKDLCPLPPGAESLA